MTDWTGRSIAVVGASLAGLNAAVALRREGFAGRLVVIGDEPLAPYDRPPLSKEIIRGDWEPSRADLAYDDATLDAEWRLGRRAVGLQAEARVLHFDDGASEQFDGIVIATGAAPRALPGQRLQGVHVLRTQGVYVLRTQGVHVLRTQGVYVLRTMNDARALRAALQQLPARVAIVGAGFIGQEVAASCRALGLAVTMIEATAPAQHVLGQQLGMILADIHRAEGVDVRLGVSVAGIEGDERVRRVQLSDGGNVDAEVVVVGIGVTPNTGWLEGSGLSIDNGVVCDATCLAAPGIVAAGDVARWPNHRYGELRRVEHWDNAVRQAQHAARRLLAADADAVTQPYEPVPWFWSDQYGHKLQLVGSAVAHHEMRIAHGSPHNRKFVALYRRGDRLMAAFGLNSASRIIKYRKLLEENPSWNDAIAAL